MFPIHCKEGSRGWQLYGRLNDLDLPTVNKASYMIGIKALADLITTYDQITLAGVTTDIGVLQNAIGLYNHAVNTDKEVAFSVRSDCVASFKPGGHHCALTYMRDNLRFDVIA